MYIYIYIDECLCVYKYVFMHTHWDTCRYTYMWILGVYKIACGGSVQRMAVSTIRVALQLIDIPMSRPSDACPHCLVTLAERVLRRLYVYNEGGPGVAGARGL